MEQTGEGFSITNLKKLELKQASQAKIATERKTQDRDSHYAFIDSGLETYDQFIFGEKGSTIKHIEKLYKSKKGPVRILDYGCGSNQMARDLIAAAGNKLPMEITGVSIGDPRTKDEIEYDRKNGIAFIDQEKSRFYPLPDSYDLILSRSTMLHFIDPLRTLKQLYNSLSMGGELRADFRIDNLVEKFFDGKNVGQAYQDAREIVKQLQESGVDIQLDERGLILRKNGNRILFKNLKYSKLLNDKGNGLYKIEAQAK